MTTPSFLLSSAIPWIQGHTFWRGGGSCAEACRPGSLRAAKSSKAEIRGPRWGGASSSCQNPGVGSTVHGMHKLNCTTHDFRASIVDTVQLVHTARDGNTCRSFTSGLGRAPSGKQCPMTGFLQKRLRRRLQPMTPIHDPGESQLACVPCPALPCCLHTTLP